jgi:YD repeat-containing protein
VAAGRIDLSWTAGTDNIGVAGYNLYRDGTKVNAAPIGSTSYSDTGLTPGANHTYKVSAIDAAGNESAQSTSWAGAAASGAVTTTYTYDAENRLTALQAGSTVLGTYAYDGAGDRVSKTVAGATTAYTLDLASGLPQVLSETTGSATTSYAYGTGPLEIDKSGTTYWYLTDTLGSVRLLTDSSGATPSTYAYSAFGSTRKTTGSIANEVRFTGERTDTESGGWEWRDASTAGAAVTAYRSASVARNSAGVMTGTTSRRTSKCESPDTRTSTAAARARSSRY